MLPHVVEINGNDRYLCKERGFLSVKSGGQCLGRLPLDDLSMVLLTGHGATLSANLLTALAERCIPIITCSAAMRPISITLPIEGHHLQSRRMALQVRAALPVQKRLWQTLVATKISMQAQHLHLMGHDAGHLHALARTVRSGDPDNLEATAAARYWPACFGKNFRRQRETPDINALLNYAYAILRAGTARAVMLSGLHPAFGIFHHNSRNSMPLVDDLMEPFRPVADMMVAALVHQGTDDVSPKAKQFLAALLNTDMEKKKTVSPVFQCLRDLSASLAAVYEGTSKRLDLPDTLLPLTRTNKGDGAEHDYTQQVQDHVDACYV